MPRIIHRGICIRQTKISKQSRFHFFCHSSKSRVNKKKIPERQRNVTRNLLGSFYAISTCQALGKIKTQKNPAIKDWIAGHNIVRIALYCKRINSHFPFSHHPSHEVLWMTGHTERKRSASYRNEMACRGVMK